MINRLVQWVEKWAAHHHAQKALALVSFVEASFFPIPPFVLIIGMLATDKKPSWVRLATIGSLASVLGGIFGYYIGKVFYEYLGAPLVAFYGVAEQVADIGARFDSALFWTIVIASLTPIPYKVFTITAGLFSVNLLSFIAASLVGRGMRFLIVSYLADRYGLRAKRFILEQQRLTYWALSILCALVCFSLFR